MKNLNLQAFYLLTKLGQFAYVTTPEALLQNKNFLISDIPFFPITII
jgi:hypothetical protein